MNAALFRRLACRPAAFLVVWGGQTERETPLCNIKLHAARFRVSVGLAALVGVLYGVSRCCALQRRDAAERVIKCKAAVNRRVL